MPDRAAKGMGEADRGAFYHSQTAGFLFVGLPSYPGSR